MNQAIKTIVIKGSYGFNNFGDDALMVAVYEVATRLFNRNSINFLCQDVKYLQKLIPNVRVFKNSQEKCSGANFLLYGGGTQFFSFSLTRAKTDTSFSHKIIRNLKQPTHIGQLILRRIRQLMPHHDSTQKVAAIGIGLGPFIKNSYELIESKKLFQKMEYVAVRDIYSYRLCQEWGCKNLSLGSDLCYLPGLFQKGKLNCCRDKNSKIYRIGVIVRDWPHNNEGNTYAEPLFIAIDSLRREEKIVEFISFSATSDREWIKRLMERQEHITVWNPDRDSITSFLRFLSGYDLFITARYHGAIFASILRKPIVAIEIENKLSLVSDLLGAGSRLWNYPFDAAQCLEHISEFERNYQETVKCIDKVVEGQMCLARKMVDDYEIFIKGNV